MRISLLTNLFSDGTVFQSNWSQEESEAIGIRPRLSRVISNAPDPEIFFPPDEVLRSRKHSGSVSAVVSSWSGNTKKGFRYLQELSNHAISKDIKLTSIGNLRGDLENVKEVGPLSPELLARRLRDADVFLALSEDDPCSNALIEAIHSGLVPIALHSGGHPELVDEDLLFRDTNELVALLKQPISILRQKSNARRYPQIAEILDEYFDFGKFVMERRVPPGLLNLMVPVFLFLDSAIFMVQKTVGFGLSLASRTVPQRRMQ